MKLLEENIGRTLNDINQNKIFYDPPPRVMEIKTKVNKWGLIRLKRKAINHKVLKGKHRLYTPCQKSQQDPL